MNYLRKNKTGELLLDLAGNSVPHRLQSFARRACFRIEFDEDLLYESLREHFKTMSFDVFLKIGI